MKYNINDVIYVTIRGANSVTIKDMLQGEYTIVQQKGWSWRYDDESKNCDLKENATVTFEKAVQNDKWLTDNSPEIR